MGRPKIKLMIEEDIAIIEEGEDSPLGMMMKKVGKITLKTPFGVREIRRIGLPGSKLHKEAKEKKAKREKKRKATVKPKAVVKRTVKKLGRPRKKKISKKK